MPLIPSTGFPLPAIFFVIPIAASTRICGFWSGIIATALAMVIVGSALLQHPLPFNYEDDERLTFMMPHVVGVLSSGVAITWMIDRLRSANQRVQPYIEALAESEERFRQLAENIEERIFWMVDLKLGRFVYASPGFESVWGVSREALYSSSDVWRKSLHPDDRDRVIELTKGMAEKGTALDYRIVRPDGDVRWVRDRGFPVRDGNGRVCRFVGLAEDVTHERLAAEALRASQERYRITTEAASEAILTLDEEGMISFANPAAARMFGFAQALDLIGQHLPELMPTSSTPFRVTCGISGVELIGRRRDGLEFPIEVSCGEYVANGRKLFSAIIRDITERKVEEGKRQQIEETLRRAKETAEAASRAKSAFLANTSHEIRTPLGAVLGFAELLANGDTTEAERERYGEAIRRNGQLLSKVINDILDLSKIEAGRLSLERVPVPLHEVLSELDTLLSLKASEKGLRLIVSTAPDLPERVWTDPLRLRQVLLNVVGNAIKFTERGSVAIRVGIQERQGRREALAFTVSDTGRGITADQARTLFEPFTQADPSTTRKFGGTGLGLALSQRLAEALGGTIELVHSTPDEGSTFRITVDPGPVVTKTGSLHHGPPVKAPKPVPGSTETLAAAPSTPASAIKLHGLRVLVAEDAADNRFLIDRLLKLAGAEVSMAVNGREAVEKAESGTYDVVLMDLQMPEMDGYEATSTLRSHGYLKPILALTAHALKDEKQRCLESGFDGHLSKPIDRLLLLTSLSHYQN